MRLKMLSESKCFESFSNDFSKREEVSLETYYKLYIDTKGVLFKNIKHFSWIYYFLEATLIKATLNCMQNT